MGLRQNAVKEALEALPDPRHIRQRLAENLRERQTLRQLLKLAERCQPATVKGASND
jgi:hypothetical protein